MPERTITSGRWRCEDCGEMLRGFVRTEAIPNENGRCGGCGRTNLRMVGAQFIIPVAEMNAEVGDVMVDTMAAVLSGLKLN